MPSLKRRRENPKWMGKKKRINKKNVCGWPCLPNWVSKRNMVRVGTKELMKNHWLVVGVFVKNTGFTE